ncbi:hypothetical protein [Streptomyces sp. Caat 7-52]|uniref:hypothetical protein n=1 Tax=Streptomyces sp. Caat 7-52 TaxID=2949637 RepID=UPI00203647FA|nr:hypothetical protein [Streptomyces sp. Caat 7-52]
MKNVLARATIHIRDIVSGRQRLKKYSTPEAHRHQHNRDAGLARHYIPTAPQVPMNGPGGM